MSTPNLTEARERILFCHRKRRNHLNLAELGLTDADLEHMPEFEKLTQLEFLDLTGNELTFLPGGLHGFNRLRWLGLNFNKLEHVEGIQRLPSLERLYLRGNLLTQLPGEFGNLNKLVELDLHGNQLVNLPLSFDDLFADRAEDALYLNLEENPGELLRAHKHGLAAFLAELQAQRKARAVVREGKLLFVGQGDVGKSTLLRALRGERFRKGEEKLKQTQGVELAPLPLPLGAAEPEVTLNGWDFSGQDPVRDTHQIFFTQPAIYLLVFKARTGTNVQTLIDWLWLIKHRTKSNAKVLIVGTEAGASPAQVADMDRVWRHFGGDNGMLLEDRIHYVECDENHPGGQIGIQELREKLLRVVKETAGFCQTVSQDMLNVRQKVEAEREKRHFMEWRDFEDLCHQNGNGLPRENVPTFARLQHEIGRLVWIDRGVLAERVILTPDWLGKALAYLFQPREDGRESVLGGISTQQKIDAEWRQPRRFATEGEAEPPLDEDLFPTFRAFMAEFDLWHPVDPVVLGDRRRYLIPKLFAPERRAWDAAWAALPQAEAKLKRQVQLNGWDGTPLNTWLMRSFFSRLIVRLYPYLLGRGNDSVDLHWRHGFRMHEQYIGEARVWFDKERGRIYFDAVGPMPNTLWSYLRCAIDGLRQEMAAPGTEMEIQIARYVPCTAAVACERDDASQETFAEEKVLLWYSKKKSSVPCNVDGCTNCDLDVALLMNGIEAASARELQRDGELAFKAEMREGMDEMRQGMDLMLHCQRRIETRLAEFWPRIDSGLRSFQNTLATVRSGLKANTDHIAVVKLLVGEVKSELLDLTHRQDDPHRLGPCLFFIEPAKPDFWKDAGDLFGKKFRLHLCCERTLLPVSWFSSTPKLGSYEFTMDEAWWAATKPVLKGVSRLLAAFVPGAGLLGNSADLSGLLAVSDSKILEHGAAILENTEKMLELPEVPDSPQAQGKKKEAPHGLPELTEASSLELKQLHSFLFGQTKVPLESANLGLIRRYDKGQRRHLWVHESQQQNYEDAREVPDRKV